MLDHGAVRGLLLQRPLVHTVRLTDRDGESLEIRATHKTKAALAQTICAKDPELIECLDEQGELLRAARAAELTLAPPKAATVAGAAAEPVIAEALKGDPQAAMISHFASLLHRSYAHATETAFAHLVQIVERMEARSSAIEMRLERAEAAYRREAHERIDDLWEQAAEKAANGDSKDQILASLAQGIMAGGNGKGTA